MLLKKNFYIFDTKDNFMLIILFKLLLLRLNMGNAQTPYSKLEKPSSWPGQPEDSPGSLLFKRGTSFVDSSRDFVLQNFENFATVYNDRPIKQNTCGVRINHALAIYTMLKELQPTTIIESGVNAGQSTYFMRAAAPRAKIISIDPKTEGVCNQGTRWVDNTNNVYLTGSDFKDLTEVDWSLYGNISHNSKTIAFLDDHLPVMTRIPSLLKQGITHVMIEDNYMGGKEIAVGLKGLLFENSQEAKEVAKDIEVYSEFPPLVYGLKFAHLSDQSSVKRRMQAKLHHTTDFRRITKPILWLDDELTGEENTKYYHRFMKMLNMQVDSAKDWKMFNELMTYNQILYLKLKTS